MSELLDKQVNVQKESLKKTSGIHASPRKKCAMKMKVEEEELEKKRRPRQKNFCERKDFIKPYLKTG